MVDCIDLTDLDGISNARYWDGSVKLTLNDLSTVPSNDCLSFDDILGDDLSSAKKILLSSYCIEQDWLIPKIKNVPKVFLVTHTSEKHLGPSRTLIHPSE